MLKSVNIARVLKLLVILMLAMFALTGCSVEDGDQQSSRTAVPAGTDTDSVVAAQSEGGTACWQSGMVVLLYDHMGKVAMGSYEKITKGALPFMMVAFALWLCFRLLKHVSSFTEENMGETWNEIARKFFWCFVCGWLASSTSGLLFVLNDVIFPVYNAFLEFAGELLSASTNGKVRSTTFFGEPMEIGRPVICKASALGAANLSAFPESPKEMMSCMVCAMNERLNLGFGLAYKVLQAPGFMATVIGLFILACFTIVKLGFVFYLVDTIFRFTVMAIMLPILIMGYPFEKTKSWLTSGFMTMINSAAFMMFMAVMIAIAILGMETVMEKNTDLFDSGVDDVNFKQLSIPFMCLMMIAFLIASSVELAQQVCDALVGGSSKGSFNQTAKSVIVGTAKFLAMGVATILAKPFKKPIEAIKRKGNQIKSKINSFAGRGGE